jgi:hypothetical protein
MESKGNSQRKEKMFILLLEKMNPAVMAFNFNDAVQCKRDGSCSKPTFA